jgi:drug/metabolite transporter (DMT)-like permease
MKKKVILYIVLTAFLFGTMEVALKIAGSEMDSFQLTFLRFMIGGIFLIPFAFKENKKNKISLNSKDYLWILLLGILCIPLSMLFFQLGIMKSNASTAAVLMSVNPLFTMVFAYVILKDKLSKSKIFGLLIGLIGIIFMIRPWDIQAGNTVIGAVLMMLAAAIFGLYSVLGKIRIEKIGIITQTCLSFIFGSMVLLVIMIFMGRPVLQGISENLVMVLYISVFVTGFGYYFYFMAIKDSDATTASMAFFIKPAIAPTFAVLILKDVLIWNTYLGIFLILTASLINLMSGKARTA